MKRNNAFILCGFVILIGSLLFAENPSNMQYVFPKDGATLVSRNTNIIIRPGSLVDPAILGSDKLIEVSGSKSGPHSGRVVLTNDQKSILFYPDIPFSSDERVSVQTRHTLTNSEGFEIAPFDFQFQTTPLSKPLNPSDYLESLEPILPNNHDLKKTDELPNFEITITGETAPGNLFLSPSKFFDKDTVGYLLMTNDNGDPLYYEKVNGTIPFDFRLQPNGLFSYGLMHEYFPFAGGGYTDFFTMDTTFLVNDAYQMENGYISDFHEFQLLPNGHALLLAYDFQPVDMSDVVEGGRPDAFVVGSIIQELDIDKNVVFQWRSWDYYDLTESINNLTQKSIDAIHINSIDVDPIDGHLIASALYVGEIIKIHRQTGEIIWHLGGKNNQFTFFNEDEGHAPYYFIHQHDVRRLSNGNITMFDNGASEFDRKYSRAVEYAIDETEMTATKVWEYRPSPDIFVPTMGSAQRLSNGNTLICWGMAALKEDASVPTAIEVDSDGNVVMELNFEIPLGSYRVQRHPFNYGKPVGEVTIYQVHEGNTYEFVDGDTDIGLTVTLIEKPGFGYNEMLGYLYDYGPLQPDFPEQAPQVLPMRFVLDQIGIPQLRVEMAFDTEFLGLENPEQIVIYYRMYEGRNTFSPLEMTYNPITKVLKTTVDRNNLDSKHDTHDEIGEFIFTYPVEPVDMSAPILSGPVSDPLINQTLPLKLTWSAKGYANYYDLQVATDSLFTTLVVDEADLMKGVYTLGALDPGIKYYWRVRASTDIDTSAWTTAWFETTAPSIQTTAPALNEVVPIGYYYFIEWKDNVDEDVVLQLYNNDVLTSVIDTVESIGAYHWDVPYNLPLGNKYEIRVQSVSDPSLFSTSGYFELDTSGTAEPSVTDYFLYRNGPNPIVSYTNFKYDLPEESDVKIEVFNILGQRVATLVDGWIGQGERQVVWQPTYLASGLYFFRMHAKPLNPNSEYREYQKVRKMMIIK